MKKIKLIKPSVIVSDSPATSDQSSFIARFGYSSSPNYLKETLSSLAKKTRSQVATKKLPMTDSYGTTLMDLITSDPSPQPSSSSSSPNYLKDTISSLAKKTRSHMKKKLPMADSSGTTLMDLITSDSSPVAASALQPSSSSSSPPNYLKETMSSLAKKTRSKALKKLPMTDSSGTTLMDLITSDPSPAAASAPQPSSSSSSSPNYLKEISSLAKKTRSKALKKLPMADSSGTTLMDLITADPSPAAQEVLSFIMHQMHEELLKFEGQMSIFNGAKSSLVSYAEDDEWETVGPKNKSVVTRPQDLVPSELSAFFGGQLQSVVKAKGNKDSATIQPFPLLHLDISHASVHTVEDALRLFSAPEMLDEYRTSITGKVVINFIEFDQIFIFIADLWLILIFLCLLYHF